MSKASPIQQDFNIGEVTPFLKGRVSLPQYKKSVELLRNYTILPHGPVKRTPGLRFVGEVRDSSKVVRMIPFSFSTTDQYVLALNDGRIQFFRNKARVLETSKNITGITNANPAVVTSTAHGFANVDRVILDSILGMPYLNGRVFAIANVTANTFELQGENTSGLSAYITGGTASRVYEITHPWADADLPKIQFAQNADTMYLVHSSYQTRKLTRTAHTSWTLAAVDFLGGPFQPDNTNMAHTMTPSATTGAITVTSSQAFFNANHVGFFLKIGGKVAGVQGYVKITGFTSNTVVSATVQKTLDGVAATSLWAIGSFNNVDGHPSSVTFFEQRLVLAGTPNQPQSVWLSKSGFFEDFTVDVNDADAISVTIATEQVNAIQWLAGKRKLFAGTNGGPFSLSSGDAATPITPRNIKATAEVSFGSAAIQPVRIGSFLYYVDRNQKRLRELRFRFEFDAFSALDMTILSEHITDDGISEIAYQQDPHQVLWCVTKQGKLASFTREVDQEVTGWSLNDTDGNFENISAIPGSPEDQVWVVVKRIISGATKRYVEFFEAFNFGAEQKNAFFVHSGLSTSDNKKTVSAFGDAKLSTAQFKLGTASLALDGAGDYLTVPDSNDFDLRSGDWAMECFVRVPVLGNYTIINHQTDVNNRLTFELTAAGNVQFQIIAALATVVTLASTDNPIVINTWKHVAITKKGTTYRLFVDGVQKGLVVDTDVPGGYTGALEIGIRGAATNALNGWIDELRISKGNARYTEPFTPTTVAFVADSYAVLLLHFDGANNSTVIMDDTKSYLTLTGLRHLEGKQIQILGDGAVQPEKTVSGGQITMDSEATTVHAGLKYQPRIKTLPIEAGSLTGTSKGMTKRINRIVLGLYQTLGLKAGHPSEIKDEVNFRSPDDPMDSPPPLFTGEVELQFTGGYDSDGVVEILQDDPLPSTVLFIAFQMTEFDK